MVLGAQWGDTEPRQVAGWGLRETDSAEATAPRKDTTPHNHQIDLHEPLDYHYPEDGARSIPDKEKAVTCISTLPHRSASFSLTFLSCALTSMEDFSQVFGTSLQDESIPSVMPQEQFFCLFFHGRFSYCPA